MYIRVLDPRKYNRKKERYGSDVFKKMGKDISVFDDECATKSSNSTCEHIRRKYRTVFSGTEPVGFLRVTDEDIEYCEEHICRIECVHTPSAKDICHCGLIMERGKEQYFLRYLLQKKRAYLCVEGGVEHFSHERFVALSNEEESSAD